MNSRLNHLAWLALLCSPLACAAPALAASLDVPLLFTDGAVLQRNQPLNVWGWAAPGSMVQVSFDGRSTQATANRKGEWNATLPAHGAGGPYTLTIADGAQKKVVHDVMVGDVWLCSGQSNMEFKLSQAQNATAEIAHANDAGIRGFTVPKSWSGEPSDHLAGGSWQHATPQAAGDFSAVCWFFAREIRARTGVPIGMIHSSWGGSRIEAWMDAASTGVSPSVVSAQAAGLAAEDRRKTQATQQRIGAGANGKGPLVDPDGEPSWAAATLDTAGWASMAVPAYWEHAGYYGMDGVAWYRTSFTLDAAEAARGVQLGLGKFDDTAQAWVNGKRVSPESDGWDIARVYHVAPALLHAGRNTIAVQATDEGGYGGIYGDADMLYVQAPGGTRHPLAGDWQFRPVPATVRITTLDGKNQLATLLYNKMIHPLIRYPLRGVLWYQGEANAGPGDASRYRDQFASMIKAWRADWKQPQLPFLWVQLANWISGQDTAQASPWAQLRASQSAALSLPATGQAVTIDIGNPDDIHPVNKQDVGHRLALAARHVVYGDTLVYAGPRYTGIRIDGARAILSFDTQGSTLAARGGELDGFQLAGADRQFHPARARIEGDTVVVSSADVSVPIAVRYGWSDNPVHANLINREGLPASPFETRPW
jgi:sialate O-acetylesterase